MQARFRGKRPEQMTCHRLQAVIGQMRKTPPRQLQSADVSVGEPHPEPSEFVRQKREIEAGVVGNKRTFAEEIAESGENLFRQGLAVKHRVGDAVNLRRLPWYRSWDPNEALEFGHDFTACNGNRAYFNDPVPPVRGKPGRLKIKNYPSLSLRNHSRFTLLPTPTSAFIPPSPNTGNTLEDQSSFSIPSPAM